MSYDYNKNGPKTVVKRESSVPSDRPDFGMATSINAGMALTPAAAREVAKIQAKICVAKSFPRNPSEAMQRIEKECSRPTVAENATYEYSRGGTAITGPSIRLAESIARSWGNIDFGFEEMESLNGYSKVRAYATDLETNMGTERTFMVEHVRATKSGKTKLTDPRDIYETIANQAARRMRACILETIPGDVVDYALSCCAKTMESKIKITPDSIQALVETFASFGVTKLQIEAFLQRNVESISTTQYIRMQSIYRSLRDGMAKPEDFFPSIEESQELRQGKGASKNVSDATVVADAQERPVDASTGIKREITPIEIESASMPLNYSSEKGSKTEGPESFVDDDLNDDGDEFEDVPTGLDDIWNA